MKKGQGLYFHKIESVLKYTFHFREIYKKHSHRLTLSVKPKSVDRFVPKDRVYVQLFAGQNIFLKKPFSRFLFVTLHYRNNCRLNLHHVKGFH